MSKTNILEDFLKHRDENKSIIFLYSILQFSKDISNPMNTFLYINEVKSYKDRYLFVMYNESQYGYQDSKKEIESHELWDFCISDDGYDIHVFTFEKYFKYYDQVVIGDYKNVEAPFKLILGRQSHPLALVAMNPEEYHEAFSEAFQIPIEDIKMDAQLISKPNPEQETLRVGEEVIKLFLEISKRIIS
jgi:hypothetical protein